MLRPFCFLSCCLLTLLCVHSVGAQGLRGQIVSQTVAARHGLERAWVGQIHLDRSRDRVADITFEDGLLLVMTDRSALHVLDAETGNVKWVQQIGSRKNPSLAACTNGESVAVADGNTLYVLDARTGEATWEQRLTGVPAAAPVMSRRYVYLPMLDGKMYAYDLRDSRKPLWVYAGTGRPDAPPLLTRHHILWTSARGLLYASEQNQVRIRYRYETQGPIVATPGYQEPLVFVASRDHYVYALEDETGVTVWRFSAASPLNHSPVPIGDSLYVVADGAGMYSLAIADGTEQWFVPGVTQFVAASPTRLYVADRSGRILILSPETGARLDALPTELIPFRLTNTQNDRIYLATETGLLQCLHEPELTEPHRHVQPIVPVADEQAEAEEAVAEEEAEDDPFDE